MTPPAAVRQSVAVLLARHGETDDNAALRFQGARNPPLNARGREQAAALGQRLVAQAADLSTGDAVRLGHDGIAGVIPPVREIWASPYARARETAEIVAAALRLPVRFDERLKESDVGDWSGRTYAEVQADDPEGFHAWVQGDLTHRFPGGESLADVSARVQSVVADARRLEPTVLCVCHGGVIRSALRAHWRATAAPEFPEPVASWVAQNGEAVAL